MYNNIKTICNIIGKKNENILVFNNKKCYNKTIYARKRVDENEIKNNIIHNDSHHNINDSSILHFRNNSI